MTNKKWSPPCHESWTSQPSISIAFSSNDPILEHCNGDNQLIIKADIGGCMIHRIYMNRGSSTKIMYEHCFQQLSNEEKASIRSLTSLLVGFCRPGTKANPEKVKAVVDMMCPRTIQEVQSLNGKLAALGRLLAKFVEKALPCFKTLKGLSAQYSWHKGRMCKGWSTLLAKHCRDQRASRSDGSRASLILTGLDGKEITYALRFDSPTSNNKSEYETLIAGLQLTLRLECADALSKLASSSFAHLTKNVFVEVISYKSIKAHATNTVEDAGETWMTPIIEYLQDGKLLEDPNTARKIKIKAPQYFMNQGVLYMKGYSASWLCCIGPNQAHYVLQEGHFGSCRAYAGARTIIQKATRFGYYWPTMYCDAIQAHRMTAKTGNHCTPFSLVYGSEAVLPPEIGVPTYRKGIWAYKFNLVYVASIKWVVELPFNARLLSNTSILGVLLPSAGKVVVWPAERTSLVVAFDAFSTTVVNLSKDVRLEIVEVEVSSFVGISFKSLGSSISISLTWLVGKQLAKLCEAKSLESSGFRKVTRRSVSLLMSGYECVAFSKATSASAFVFCCSNLSF
ncbi:hypothetical protein Tco_0438010 [Tanacetum coccineum]